MGKEIKSRNAQMYYTMDQWTSAFYDGAEYNNSADEMEEVLDWWTAGGNTYNGPSEDEVKANGITQVLDQVGDKTVRALRKTKELQDAISWWDVNGHQHVESMADIDLKVEKFKKVDNMLDWYAENDKKSG